jgi:hypothetical protein
VKIGILIRRSLLSRFWKNCKNYGECVVLSFTVSRCPPTLYEARLETQWKYKGAAESVMADCSNRLCSVCSWNEAAVME